MMGSNYSPELQAAGLTTPGTLVKQWDFTFGMGGPILKDRLWYRVAVRDEGQHRTIPNIYPNLNAGTAERLYSPDRTKEVRGAESWRLYTRAADGPGDLEGQDQRALGRAAPVQRRDVQHQRGWMPDSSRTAATGSARSDSAA